jgi:uncharacterized protein YdcH (DUF465 family)
MSIREIAKELYKLIQKINTLKSKIKRASEAEKVGLTIELTQMEKERATLEKRLNTLKKNQKN